MQGTSHPRQQMLLRRLLHRQSLRQSRFPRQRLLDGNCHHRCPSPGMTAQTLSLRYLQPGMHGCACPVSAMTCTCAHLPAHGIMPHDAYFPLRGRCAHFLLQCRRSLDNIGEPLPRSAPGRVPPPPRPPPRAVPPGGPGPPPRPMQGGPFRQPPRPGFPPGPRPPARRPPAQQYDGDSYDEIYEEHMGMPQQWPQVGPQLPVLFAIQGSERDQSLLPVYN